MGYTYDQSVGNYFFTAFVNVLSMRCELKLPRLIAAEWFR